jgi:hypothetical protein
MTSPDRTLRRYRVTDCHGDIIAEGSFGTFGQAKEWAASLEIEGGCTLLHRTSSGWSVLRRYPGSSSSDVGRSSLRS